MIEYRPAIYDDYPAIASLHAASWRQHYRGIFSDSYLDSEVEKNRMEVWKERLFIPASNQMVTIAMKEDEIVGFACLYLDHDPDLGSMLDNLHVAKLMHGQKIGIGLMRICAKKLLADALAKKMHLWVFELNTAARAVYEKSGGIFFESVETTNEDCTNAVACCYTWNKASLLSLIGTEQGEKGYNE